MLLYFTGGLLGHRYNAILGNILLSFFWCSTFGVFYIYSPQLTAHSMAALILFQDSLWGNAIHVKEANSISVELRKNVSSHLDTNYSYITYFIINFNIRRTPFVCNIYIKQVQNIGL